MMPTAAEVFRDFATDGVPSSGVHEPEKAQIRELLTGFENAIATLPSVSGGYDIIIGMGQSNAVGSGTGGPWPTNNNVLVWQGGYNIVGTTAAPLTTARRGQTPFASDSSNNLLVHAADAYQRATGRPVIILLCARGGTSITEMNAPGGQVYDGLISNMAALLAVYPTARVAGMLWHQGEADQFETTAWYLAEFDTLLANLRAQTWWPAEAPIICGELYFGQYSALNQWKQNESLSLLPLRDHRVALVSSAGLDAQDEDFTDSAGAEYRVHFTGASLAEYGLRYGAALRAMINGYYASARFNVAERLNAPPLLQVSPFVVADGGTLTLTLADLAAFPHIKCSGDATINLPDFETASVSSYARGLTYKLLVFCNVNNKTITLRTNSGHTIGIGNGAPGSVVTHANTRAPLELTYFQDGRWRGLVSA